MLVSPDSIEIPDTCPETCAFRGELEDFFDYCRYCPVFNCRTVELSEEDFRAISGKDEPYNDETKKFRALEPEDYRSDWAREWLKFFNGESDVPELKFLVEE
jgi:hypothetical protein